MVIIASCPNYSGFIPQYPTNLKVNLDYTDKSYNPDIYSFDVYYEDLDTEIWYLLAHVPRDAGDTQEIVTSATIPLPTDYSPYDEKQFLIIVQYFDVGGRFLGYDNQHLTLRGRYGTSIPTPIVNDDDILYPIVDKDIVTFSRSEGVYDSTHQASGLVDTTTYCVWDWFITYNGGYEQSITNAESNGIIKINSHSQDTYNSTLGYTGKIKIKFLLAGTYVIKGRIRWKSTNNYTTPYYSFSFSNSRVYRAYNPSKPSITLVSITPTEYQTGSDDPLNGLPPYTVQYRDDSAAADPNQIPQKNIVVDFGEPGSGTLNKIFIENTGSTLITVPIARMLHIYSGYDACVAQITVTDKNGNITTSNAQFAPNQTPRLIKPPVLTPLAGDQPLLVEGNAYVAGVPLPDVTWAYVLRDGNPDYYAGEKEGVYAQLSLLAGGTYDVTCEAKNEDTVIDTTPFEVEVDPQDTYEDAAVAMNNFDVAVYDSGGNLVDLMQPADHVKFIDKYVGGSVGTFRVSTAYRFIDRLRKYCIFDIGYLGKARRMVVTAFVVSGDKTYVEISGIELPAYISGWRAATIATQSTSGNGKDLQICSGEALLRYWATVNNEVGTLREIGELVVVEANQDRGGKCVYSARYDTIREILEAICSDSGLGWESSLQASGKVGLKIREGVNRDILFSEAPAGVRNAIIDPYSEYAAANVAIGAGAGEGATRQYTDFGETTASGLNRRELFVDAGDSATDEEVEREAKLALVQQKDEGLYVTPTPDCPHIFGVDYFVGDYVSVETCGFILPNMQIVSAEATNYPGEGVVARLYCGTDRRNEKSMMRRIALENTYSKK